MPKNKTLRYLIFASLYFTQGTILGYFASLNALYLLDNGLSMTKVGIFGAIALIPFVIKIFWACFRIKSTCSGAATVCLISLLACWYSSCA